MYTLYRGMIDEKIQHSWRRHNSPRDMLVEGNKVNDPSRTHIISAEDGKEKLAKPPEKMLYKKQRYVSNKNFNFRSYKFVAGKQKLPSRNILAADSSSNLSADKKASTREINGRSQNSVLSLNNPNMIKSARKLKETQSPIQKIDFRELSRTFGTFKASQQNLQT